MKLLRYIFPVLAAVAFSSCEKEIEFEYMDIPAQHVVQGLLTQEGVNVTITKTVPTDEPFNNDKVTDATLTVVDIDTKESYSLLPDEAGIFTCAGFSGQPGHEYELTVCIGEDVSSSTCRMLAPSEIVEAEFSWIDMTYDDVAVLKVLFTEDKDKLTSYWLRMYRNGEPYQSQVIQSRNAVDGLVTALLMTSRKNTAEENESVVLKEGDRIDIEVMPISQRIDSYFNSLNNGDYNGDRLFSGSFCLGYFLAAPVSRKQLIYHPDEIQPFDSNP